MDYFQWNDCFVTGVAMVDEQHHQLVDIMNRFGEVVMRAGPSNRAELDLALGEVTDYAQYHFQEEEAMMLASGLDIRHIKHHCTEHVKFLQDVTTMQAEAAYGNFEETRRLLSYLTNWLAYHILGTDQTMTLLVNAVKQGKSQHEAYLAAQHDRDPATAILLHAITTLFNQVTGINRDLLELNQTLEKRIAERTSELVTINQQLETMAMTDVLTGLPNRRHALKCFNQLWQQSCKQGTSLTCMMIDADGFKTINDRYGHEAGDQVLRQLARRLRSVVRNDDVVCRLGGDEFLILCADTTLIGATTLAEKLCQEVALLQVPAGNGVWQGSVSIGVAERTKSTEGFDDLLKLADAAVYAAKKDGRNCVATVQAAHSN